MFLLTGPALTTYQDGPVAGAHTCMKHKNDEGGLRKETSLVPALPPAHRSTSTSPPASPAPAPGR